MNLEEFPSFPNQEQENKEAKKQESLDLCRELEHEQFVFAGIKPEVYVKLKAEEEELANTPMPFEITKIDDLIARFEQEGYKISLGKYPESGNIFVMPAGSESVEQDSLFLRQLEKENMDPRLLKILELAQNF